MNNITNPITAEVRTIAPEVESVKNLALAKMEALEKVRDQRKTAREMFTDALNENTEYAQAAEDYRKAKQNHDLAKRKAMQNPRVYDANVKIKDLTREYNELKGDIGDYLVTYADKTGQLSFLAPDGNEVRINRTAKPKIIRDKRK